MVMNPQNGKGSGRLHDRQQCTDEQMQSNAQVIRELSLLGKNKEIRNLLISEQGKKVWRWVMDERHATTAQVASEFKLSVQHASGVLSKLYKQGYLGRYEQQQESGGKEWVYYT